jgi:outer membrane protein TolC
MQTAAREIAQALEQLTDQDRRSETESGLRTVRARLAEAQAQLFSSEARLAEARQALELETGRYDELDGWLKDLDRQLQTGG